ncbi:MAG TPA: hypothetical protein QGF02_03495 [Candidatus Babeliales bacterium]|nr:hypothetical protein [Candidatus Babeliales bacterium]
MNNDNSYKSDGQFILSFELLQLLEWLIEHQPDEIKKLVHKALAQGLHSNIRQAEDLLEAYSPEDMQNSVIDYFGLMEVLLLDAINERSNNSTVHTQLLPTVNQIDQSSCDADTVFSSVENATSSLEENSLQNPKAVLHKELLKNWKPDKKAKVN